VVDRHLIPRVTARSSKIYIQPNSTPDISESVITQPLGFRSGQNFFIEGDAGRLAAHRGRRIANPPQLAKLPHNISRHPITLK
jgi:hypothetical protein